MHLPRRLSAALMVLAAALLMGLTAGNEPQKARATMGYNLETGKTYRLHVNTIQDMEQEVQGRTQEVYQDINHKLSYRVEGREGEKYTLSVSYEQFAFTTETPAATISYDSETSGKRTRPMFYMLDALIGNAFTVRMSTSGEILEISGVEEVMTRAIEEAGVAKSSRSMSMLNNMIGPETLKFVFESQLGIYPPSGAAQEGDSWNRELRQTVGMRVQYDRAFSLEESGSEAHIIEMESDAETISGGDSRPGRIFDLEGEQEGTIRVDAGSGWIIESKIEAEMHGELIVNAGTKQEVVVPMEVRQTIISKPY